MACCSCVGRKGLWYFWGFNALIASIFSIIAVSHGAVLDKIIVNNKAANSILDAAIAGITCSVFLNVGYLIITALILLRKTIALNGAGAPFGFMIALSLMMFFNQVQVRRKEYYHSFVYAFFSLSLQRARWRFLRSDDVSFVSLKLTRSNTFFFFFFYYYHTGWLLPPIYPPLDRRIHRSSRRETLDVRRRHDARSARRVRLPLRRGVFDLNFRLVLRERRVAKKHDGRRAESDRVRERFWRWR
jgi:hypothetical protein